MEIFLLVLEIIGTIAFAIGGASLAIKNKMDVLGVMILGLIAAMGGGVIRDIVLNNDIVLFEQPIYLFTAVITSLIIFIIFYFTKKVELFDNNIFNLFLNITDAIGLGVFVVIGANVAISLTDNIILIIFCSLITAVGGGILRDVFVNRIPNIFRKHIYAIAAIMGLTIYLVLNYYDLEVLGSIICIIVIVVMRVISQIFKLSLPKVQV